MFVVDARSAQVMNNRGDGSEVNDGDVLPAMIVQVWDGNLVNLKVFRDADTDFWITSVSAETSTNTTRCWRWQVRVQ